MSRQSFRQLIALIVLGAAVIVLNGQGCGQFQSQVQNGVGTLLLNSTPPETVKVIPNTKTLSMSYARQIVDSMVSCTGLRQATDGINNAYEERKGSLSEYGYALEVSAPMLMAAVTVAGEVCNELIEREMPSNQRRIFNRIDFSRSPSSLSDDAIGETVRRLARSCWARNETADELNIILSEMKGAFANESQSKEAMLMICTSVLSSLSGLEM